MSARRTSKRVHVEGQRVCIDHGGILLDDPCWCGVIHCPREIDHGDDCPAVIL